ncbi:hypothetical protein L6164_015504 [Bauhinia variegata]|uniref:Uncharacterized protein n=1 Tax=Bauhinia variegata TaxID=167791 RepID=A0ACB9NM51_BAUVA|nr:hypothetical protein L6164_015504 [Bauhinia variegata]
MKTTSTDNLSIFFANSPSNPSAMDPRIWSRLPVELLEHILSLLPLKTFWNLRSTCKRFRYLVFSPSFISKYSSSSLPFSSFLLLAHPQCHRYFPLYDSNLGTWRSTSLPLSDLHHCWAPSALLSSSGGLFCLSDFTSSSSSFLIVCNLLAKSSRKIEFPTYSFRVDHLTLVSTAIGYKIFVLCSESAYVYDSILLSWRRFDGFDPILSENDHQEGAFHYGGLYFTTPEPFSVVRFDLESGKWERPNAVLPSQVTFVRLASDGEGKLYLVGGVGNNGISRSMKLWEMGESENWVEVASLPEMMCRKFMSVCYHNYEHVYCFWHLGMICICCYTWPEILYYKVSRKTWHWLPRSPALPEKCSCAFRWFSFVPNLYSPV